MFSWMIFENELWWFVCLYSEIEFAICYYQAVEKWLQNQWEPMHVWNFAMDSQTSTICRCISCWTFAFPMRFYVWLEGKTSKCSKNFDTFVQSRHQPLSDLKDLGFFRWLEITLPPPSCSTRLVASFAVCFCFDLGNLWKFAFLFMVKNSGMFRDFHTCEYHPNWLQDFGPARISEYPSTHQSHWKAKQWISRRITCGSWQTPIIFQTFV